MSGDFAGATARWEALAAQYLRDLLALKLAQYGFFYAGESERMRDAGIDEKQAEAITGVLRDVHDADLSRLATKDDLAALRAELRAEMATLHTELKSEIELLRRDLTIRLGGMIVVPGGFLTAIKFLG